MLHLPPLIRDLGLILSAAAVVAVLFKLLRQPVVLGYLVAGLIVGPHLTIFPSVTDMQSVHTWAEIGVIFLLFALGLEFSFKKLMRVGGPASITAGVEIVGMLVVGYATGKLLGWSSMDSIFLGGVLSISSTTIIIRAFEELGVKGKKFASLVFGVLIVEDLIAILLLVLLSTIAVSRQFEGSELLGSMFKLGFFLTVWFVVGIFIFPTLLRRLKKHLNDEMTLVLSIAFCLLTVLLAVSAGFSPALGAFIMGSVLAETVEAEKIEHLVKPVRDLFAAVFFVSVGMLFDPAILGEYWQAIAIITLVTIGGKLFASAGGALLSGQPLKTSVQTGMSLAQIGEFSFIIATLGLSLKVTSDFLYPIAVAVSAITTFTTPYLIRYSGPFASWLERMLPRPWVERMARYASATQGISASDQGRSLVRVTLSKLLLHGFLATAIFFLATKFLRPFAFRHLGDGYLPRFLMLGVTLLLASPFLWALVLGRYAAGSWASFRSERKYRAIFVVLESCRVGTALTLITILVSRYFSAWWALTIPIVGIGAILFFFANRFESIYLWLENRFLTNFNEREHMDHNKDRKLPEIAPWEAHIARFRVSPESDAVGRTLVELGIREKFGVTVAMIERGNRVITAPTRDMRLYPYDEVAAIGEDAQLEAFRVMLEPQSSAIASDGVDGRYQLQSKIIAHDSPLIGKPIRTSGIREATSGLVVGIEREGKRILNPDSTLEFKAGDLVWIVGDREKILGLR